MRSLFLYSPVGGGHYQASRALAQAWLARRPGWTSRKIDYLQYLPALERRLWPGLYHLSLRWCPSLWRTWRRFTDRPDEPRFIRDRVSDAGAAGFARLLDREQPSLVVSTIGGAAALAGAARARLGSRFVNALVVSGFRAHQHWARREADLFFVAGDEAKDDLVRRGIDAARVHVTGIPIDEQPREDKATLRAELGLGTDPVLLISSGATGAYRAHERLLDELARLDRPMDVVTFKPGGFERRGRMRLHRLGFREDFCRWLAASDLVVGKLGGHTAAEALANGVPMVVYEPIAGQEEDNAEWVVARGAAVWPRDGVRQTVAHLLDDEGERVRLSKAGLRLARPDAAARVTAVLAEALS